MRKVPYPQGKLDLQGVPYKILFETYRVTEGKRNWELYQMDADGSNAVNLTRTPHLDEMYPHASPDGSKICFVVDEGGRREKVRNVYTMNIDGTGRVKVATNARQPCWSPDGKTIAYLKGEYERYSTREYATAKLLFYDLRTGQHRAHPNRNLHHLYAICWSPDGNWFLAAVHGGMGYSDTILAFEADGTRVFDLERWGVRGCRPDFSQDGKRITWGQTDWDLCVGDIDFASGEPRVRNVRKIVECLRTAKVYHVDFSPDGKYIVFSYGPSAGGQQVGGFARGWDICVTNLTGPWIKVTHDGNHNKEPDWVPIASTNP
ncbi:MAG: PD40 domain-containing protein [Phycisphaerales bacterium]|nr:MAG: PD40 domain-containing protein [Phycisphaerales bacterium]